MIGLFYGLYTELANDKKWVPQRCCLRPAAHTRRQPFSLYVGQGLDANSS